MIVGLGRGVLVVVVVEETWCARGCHGGVLVVVVALVAVVVV